MASILTYAVGDIHGSFGKLVSLLNHCIAHCADNECRFIFVGDYIDRGRKSFDVVKLLMQTQAVAPELVICLSGNHEDMLVRAAHCEDEEAWIENGGDATLRSYGVRRAAEIPGEHLQWFERLPVTVNDGKRLFVHAGIMPGVPLDQQEQNVLLWIREPFLQDERDHGLLIVHGHTPIDSELPDLRPNRLNLDTGACFGGPLSAAVFDEDSAGPLAFISHNGRIVEAPALTALAESS